MSELDGAVDGAQDACGLDCLRCETPCGAWAILREARDWQERLDGERLRRDERRHA